MHSRCNQENQYGPNTFAALTPTDVWATMPDSSVKYGATDFVRWRSFRGQLSFLPFVAALFFAIALPVLAETTGDGTIETATRVNVVGLAKDTAILTINGGKPRLMRIGQSRAGVKLIATHADHAIVEIDGERIELTLGDNAYTPQKSGLGDSVTLSADSRGHFMTRGSINGTSVSFLVDTGASMVSMGVTDARKAGINYLEGIQGFASTANGVAPVYRVKLDTVAVGQILLRNVDGIVHAETDLPFVLLGMSFLQQLDMRRDANILTLKKRF